MEYSRQSEYSDIDKVMCYLTGEKLESCYTIYDALKHRFQTLGRVGKESFNGTCKSQFFNIRFFKKGTLHLEFNDTKLWEEFNTRACRLKNWLPPAEAKKEKKQEATPTTGKELILFN